MGVTVVCKASVWGDSFATVPDFSDLEQKADCVTLENKIFNVTNLINNETTNRQNKIKEITNQISSIKNDLTLKASKDEVKNILSATYLNKVKSDISELYNRHIKLVQEEVQKNHDRHKKDIDAFEEIAKKANNELASRFIPINNSIRSFNERIEYLIKCVDIIGDIDTKTSQIDKQIKQAQEDTTRIIKDIIANVESKASNINNQLNKFQENADNISKKTIEDVELKISSLKQQLRQTKDEADIIITELRNLRNDLEIAVAIECEKKIDHMVISRFEILKTQLFSKIAEKEKVTKGFWAKLFGRT